MSFFRKAGSETSDSESSSEEELLSDSGDDSGLENKIAKAPAAAGSGAPVKKSRFAKSSGEDSDSSDEDDDSDADSDAGSDAAGGKSAAGPKVSRFAKGAASDTDSDDEDDGKRVVKSAKSKRAEELEAGVKKVENAVRIDDWVTANSGQSTLPVCTIIVLTVDLGLTEFDKITRLVASSPGNVLAMVTIPAVYIKVIGSLETSISEAGAKKKKLNATHSKALNGMKQKVKKAQREHEELIKKYNEVRICAPFGRSGT